MYTKNGDYMLNYYRKSEKEFKEYVKINPNCTKEEWNEYAQENCLFSANTLMFHLLHEDLIKYLNKENKSKFEYLKSMFLIIPIKYRDNKILNTFLKINKLNKTKGQRIKENG